MNELLAKVDKEANAPDGAQWHTALAEHPIDPRIARTYEGTDVEFSPEGLTKLEQQAEAITADRDTLSLEGAENWSAEEWVDFGRDASRLSRKHGDYSEFTNKVNQKLERAIPEKRVTRNNHGDQVEAYDPNELQGAVDDIKTFAMNAGFQAVHLLEGKIRRITTLLDSVKEGKVPPKDVLLRTSVEAGLTNFGQSVDNAEQAKAA